MPAKRSRRTSPVARRATHTPSIFEVARRCGVSVATVSRVLNEKGPVRAATRERVLAAVAELGYVPHAAARSLSTRRAMLIGVVLPDMHGEFFSETVRGIDRAARASGYHLLVSGSHGDPAETEDVLQALHGRVDGLILMAPGLEPTWLAGRLPRRLPVVLLNPRDEGPRAKVARRLRSGDVPSDTATAGHPTIRIDNRRGARLAVEHLVGLGHRAIAFVTGPSGNSDASERLRGYQQELKRHGIAFDARLVIAGDFSEESGGRAGEVIAGLKPRPTAVFAANDAMAIGCLGALRERGLEVPADVSLVGFDDIPIARYLSPALTTVRVPILELGQRAMSRLLSTLERGERTASDEVIAPTLAIRASAARPDAPTPRSRRKRRTSP